MLSTAEAHRTYWRGWRKRRAAACGQARRRATISAVRWAATDAGRHTEFQTAGQPIAQIHPHADRQIGIQAGRQQTNQANTPTDIQITITLGSLWDHFGITLGSLWDHVGITLESLWDHVGITVGSLCDHFGITLGSLWHHFGITLGSLWDRSGVNVTALQAHRSIHFVSRF